MSQVEGLNRLGSDENDRSDQQKSVLEDHREMREPWHCHAMSHEKKKNSGFLGLVQEFSLKGPLPNAMSENVFQLCRSIKRNN